MNNENFFKLSVRTFLGGHNTQVCDTSLATELKNHGWSLRDNKSCFKTD